MNWLYDWIEANIYSLYIWITKILFNDMIDFSSSPMRLLGDLSLGMWGWSIYELPVDNVLESGAILIW